MRTTLDLDPTVLGELRRRGEREHKSMGRVASELLAAALAETHGSRPASKLAWKAADLGEPLVDIDDKEALRRTLDART